ncbi:CxxxxCH/CxxCH domain-containing protein, partial [bacterium]|nr:CxxxxCH/CxxCH domain-containing protein [bacterium]
MGTENRTKRTSGAVPALVVVAASLVLALVVLCGTGSALAGTITTCAGCHGMPPVDAAYRNISTGQFGGTHTTHSWASGGASNCAKCHRMPSSNAHRSGSINFVSNLNNSPVQARYRNMTSVPQTAAPAFGTCSNVNCHFEAATPQWGSALFSAPADCNKCHGAPPSGGGSGAAGSHAKHDLYYSGAANCQKCHSNKTTFQHATSAGHRNLNISFAAAPNNGSGSYSGALNDYLPSQANAFGSCTALYCHSPGNKASSFDAPNQAATWGGSLTCTGCHKSNNASGDIMASGSHGRHVNATKFYTIGCNKCHASTVSGAMTISDPSAHVNAKVNIAFN